MKKYLGLTFITAALITSGSHASNQKVQVTDNSIFWKEITLESTMDNGGGYCTDASIRTYGAKKYTGHINALLYCPNEVGSVAYDPKSEYSGILYIDHFHLFHPEPSYDDYIYTDQDVSFKLKSPEFYCLTYNVRKVNHVPKDSLKFTRKNSSYDREYGVLSMETFASGLTAMEGGNANIAGAIYLHFHKTSRCCNYHSLVVSV